MLRNSMKLCGVCALLIAVVGCDKSPGEEKAEANKEIAQAQEKAREAEVDARDEPAGEAAREVAEANKDMAEKTAQEMKEVANAENDDAGEYERFEALKDETKTAFSQRAEAALTKVETDLKAIESQALAKDDTKDDVNDAKEALAEARKDLQEVTGTNDKAFDDGKVGVAMAINKAQREVADLREELGTK